MEQIYAAIIGSIVTGLLAFFAYLYQQRLGNRVIVKMISQSPQITFEDSVQQKLEIIYNGKKIKDLVLTQFTISNQGSNIIKPLKLTVNVKPKSGLDLKVTTINLQPIISNFTFAELNVNDPLEITTSKMDSQTGSFEIERPYLNPQKKYKEEEIKVSVFSDVELDFSVSGGGEDWAIKYVKASEEMAKRRSFWSSNLGMFTFILAPILFIYFTKKDTNQNENEPIVLVVTILIMLALFTLINIISDYISREFNK